MARVWFEFRWMLAALLLCAVLKLVEREAPTELLRHLQGVGDDLLAGEWQDGSSVRE